MRPSPQTILLRNSSGKLAGYVPTPAQRPEPKHSLEAFRDRTYWAMPFPPSQPPIYGSKIYPGRFKTSDSRNPFTWTYVEAQLPNNGGLTRHFLRRSPDGHLHLKDELLGQTYRIIGHNIDDSYPAEPGFLPEKPQTRSLVSIHCETYYGENDYPIHRYYVAERLPDGTIKVPRHFLDNCRVLQKSDGSLCFRPKAESTVPEAWQPHPKERHKLIIDVEADNRIAQSNQAQQPSEEPTQAKLDPEPEPKQEKQQAQTNDPITKSPSYPIQDHACTETSRSANEACTEACQSGNSGDENRTDVGRSSNPINPKLPNYQVTQLPNASLPDPLDPIQTMDELTDLIRQHLVCTEAQRTVLALWILHTYAYKAAHLTPYLNISSRVEESGKSTCMTILRSLCAHPWWAAGVSRSAFTRKTLADRPTVLLDNWQTVFSSSDKTQLTGFLLNGCDQPPNVDHAPTDSNYPITNLPTYPIPSPTYPIPSPNYPIQPPFCPKAFAGPEPLPPSLARRSIPIILQRRRPNEIVKPAMKLLTPGATGKLTHWMQAWARTHERQIETTLENCALPGLSPHQQESASVLIALAETIGGHWSQKARTALGEVFQDAQDEASSLRLLTDIRDAFAHHGNPERIFSSELLDFLHDLDQRVWHEWGKKGDPMTPHALSVILRKSFKIYSRSQRRGEEKRRGYQLSDFLEAWERYLPTQTPQNTSDQNATKEGHETSVAATIEPVSLEKKSNSGSPDNKHRIRRAEVARNEVSQRRAEVRQRAKTAAPRRVPALSKLKAGCRRILNRFTAKVVGLLTITHQ